MIRWCAYCQQFLGEFPPYERWEISHGMCHACQDKGLEITSETHDRMHELVELQGQFWQAGRTEDLDKVRKLVTLGFQVGVRPIDMIFGFAGPALTRVGELWAKNQLTVAEEHRFTRSVEFLVDTVSQSFLAPEKPQAPDLPHSVLLSHVVSNEHVLGLRFVQLGLSGLGIKAQIAEPGETAEKLLGLYYEGQHDAIGLSISMPEQIPRLIELIKELLADRNFTGRIIVGGAVVNAGVNLGFSHPKVSLTPRPSFRENDNWLERGGDGSDDPDKP